MKITVPSLIRWSGLAAVLAGASYALVGILHPANVAPSVLTSPWEISHILAMGLSLFGLFGLTGLYARQAEKSGWLGLSGYLLLSPPPSRSTA